MTESMQRCGGCRRHVAAHEVACPFCRGRVGLVAASTAIVLAVAMVGCGDGEALEGSAAEASSESGSTGASGTASLSSTSAATVADTSSSGFDTAMDTSTSEIDTGVSSNGFIYGAPDGGDVTIECDVWSQDCRAGSKCVPWANDGGQTWNATRCSPLADDPREVGEGCIAEGSAYSGIDDCVLGAVCWDVDDATLEGTCVAQCGGSEAAPECTDPLSCFIANAGVLTLCLPTCDPLMSDCPPDEVCAPSDEGHFCLPDASGAGGPHGDGCPLDAPGPGLMCATASVLPG